MKERYIVTEAYSKYNRHHWDEWDVDHFSRFKMLVLGHNIVDNIEGAIQKARGDIDFNNRCQHPKWQVRIWQHTGIPFFWKIIEEYNSDGET